MKAKQLSVFLENKSGRLTEVTEALGGSLRREDHRCNRLRLSEHQWFVSYCVEALV